MDREEAELAHCSENSFLLQQKYAVLNLLEHETLDIKNGAVAILGMEGRTAEEAFLREKTPRKQFNLGESH